MSHENTTETAAEAPVTPTTTEGFLAEMEAARNPQEAEIPQDDTNAAQELEVTTEAITDATDAPVDDSAAELDRLRSEHALYESLLGDTLTKELGLEEPEAAPAVEKEDVVEAPSLLEPMEFSVTDDEFENVMAGDAKTFVEVLARQGKAIEHNLRLQQNQAIAQGIMWYLPVANATTKFAERNPEFVKLPKAGETVGKLLTQARRDLPHADEATLVRHVENKLSPALKRVKQIVSDAQQRRELGPSKSPVAKQPTARAAAPGGTRQPRALTGMEEAEALINKFATRY